MKIIALIATVAALMVSHEVNAQRATTFGKPDCGQWKTDQKTLTQIWLLGYLSGLNYMWSEMGEKPADPLSALGSADQAFAWMDNYCRDSPLETINTGAVALLRELAKRKSQGK